MRTIQNNLQQCRIELYENGNLAGFLQYRMEGGQMWLLYTQMSGDIGDSSLADDLILRALQNAQRRRLEVLPFCPVVRRYMTGHPHFLHLVPSNRSGHFPLLRRDADVGTAHGFKTLAAVPGVSAKGWPADGLSRKPKPSRTWTERPRKRAQQRMADPQPCAASIEAAHHTAEQTLRPTLAT